MYDSRERFGGVLAPQVDAPNGSVRADVSDCGRRALDAATRIVRIGAPPAELGPPFLRRAPSNAWNVGPEASRHGSDEG